MNENTKKTLIITSGLFGLTLAVYLSFHNGNVIDENLSKLKTQVDNVNQNNLSATSLSLTLEEQFNSGDEAMYQLEIIKDTELELKTVTPIKNVISVSTIPASK